MVDATGFAYHLVVGAYTPIANKIIFRLASTARKVVRCSIYYFVSLQILLIVFQRVCKMHFLLLIRFTNPMHVDAIIVFSFIRDEWLRKNNYVAECYNLLAF